MGDPIVATTDIKHSDILAVKWQFWIQAETPLPTSTSTSTMGRMIFNAFLAILAAAFHGANDDHNDPNQKQKKIHVVIWTRRRFHIYIEQAWYLYPLTYTHSKTKTSCFVHRWTCSRNEFQPKCSIFCIGAIYKKKTTKNCQMRKIRSSVSENLTCPTVLWFIKHLICPGQRGFFHLLKCDNAHYNQHDIHLNPTTNPTPLCFPKATLSAPGPA